MLALSNTHTKKNRNTNTYKIVIYFQLIWRKCILISIDIIRRLKQPSLQKNLLFCIDENANKKYYASCASQEKKDYFPVTERKCYSAQCKKWGQHPSSKEWGVV